ncbi:MAG: glycoside hydrolase family 13 protein [Spirochaetaceae bacterium]|nr:glycoside hydrolase family 13 protein [Spirochaetaceae bacterium]
MNGASLYHRSLDSFCYSPDGESMVVRLQAAADDVASVDLWVGDPYEWSHKPGIDSPQGTWHCHRVPAQKIGSDGLRDFWEARWKTPYRRARYFFRITGLDGSRLDYGEKGLVPCNPDSADSRPDFWNTFLFPYIHETDIFRVPEWVARTVWYEIFPDRFCNGDSSNDPADVQPWGRLPKSNSEFYGGDLKGIIQKLDHIESLGCNGIYLTPIFASPTAHKYDTADYLRIDPSFGTEGDLRELVQACKARGIRIILDAVFNHAGREFGPWEDVIEKGPDSRYRDWFHIRDFPLFPLGKDTGDSRDTNFETFGFTTRMPKLNTSNPDMREYLLEVAVRYVRDFGIDGWRLDVANEVDHAFWREFRRRVKAVNPDAYIVGEVWLDAMPWLRGDQYDGVMNYPFELAISDFLCPSPNALIGRDFLHRIDAISFSYPDTVMKSMFNLVDSHDTDRIITRFGGRDPAKCALVLLFALPGSPCIYYGTEYALEGGRDPDCRRCMVWDPDPAEREFADFVTALVRVRRTYWKTFAEGTRRGISLADFPGFVAFILEGEGRRIALMVNRDPAPIPAQSWKTALEVKDSVKVQNLLSGKRFDDALGGRDSAVFML